MFEFGSIILVPFPFSDLSHAKVRPALIVSRYNPKNDEVILCFITSKVTREKEGLILQPGDGSGVKVRSCIRFDKMVTLSKKIILGEIGKVEPKRLQKQAASFFGIFGFDV